MLTCWQLLATIQHNPHLTPNLAHLLKHYEDELAGKSQQQALYCLAILLKKVSMWHEYEWNCCLENHDELVLLFLMLSASAEDWDQIWATLWRTRSISINIFINCKLTLTNKISAYMTRNINVHLWRLCRSHSNGFILIKKKQPLLLHIQNCKVSCAKINHNKFSTIWKNIHSEVHHVFCIYMHRMWLNITSGWQCHSWGS